MTRSIPFFSMCVAAWLAPHVALAQPAAGTVFVAASGFADIRRAPTTTLLRGPNDDSSGTVPGGALALGVYLAPRLSVRAEWSLSDTLSSSRDLGIYPYAADDLVSTLLPGIVPPNSLVVPQEVTEERDVKAGFALLGYHLTAGRASIEILGGVGLVNERVTLVTELHLPRLPDIPDYRSEVHDLGASCRGGRRRRRGGVAHLARRPGAAGAAVFTERRAPDPSWPRSALDVLTPDALEPAWCLSTPRLPPQRAESARRGARGWQARSRRCDVLHTPR